MGRIDRENVIAELKTCASGSCKGCRYFMNWDNNNGRCSDALKMDAVKLLEEQEPLIIHKYEFDEIYNYIAVCPECEMNWAMWEPDRMRYCPGCGRAVKWDG